MDLWNKKNPLYDLGLEAAVIGAFLIDPKNVAIARPLIAPEQFYEPLHQLLVQMIYEFEEEGRDISPLTVNSWVKHLPVVQDANRLLGEQLPPGQEAVHYMVALVQACPAMPNVAGYADVLADLALRRQAVWAMGEAEDMLNGREGKVPSAIMPALKIVVDVADEIGERQIAKDRETASYRHVDTMLRDIESQAVNPQQFGVPTGIAVLDEILGGMFPGQLLVVGGRPGMGKSIFGLEMALAAARDGSDADYWSIEMPERECAARLIANLDYDDGIAQNKGFIHYESLVKMRANSAVVARAARAREQLAGLNIDVFDRSRVRMSEIAAVSRARAARSKNERPRLVVVDHLHRVTPEERYKGRRVDELSEMTGMAKDLAKRNNGIVLLLCQLSRDIERREDKHPVMADFRDSGSIEQDADVVMALFRGEYYGEQMLRQAKNEEQRVKAEIYRDSVRNKLDIEVLKQRSGKTATVSCWIEPKAAVIRDRRPDVPTRQADMLSREPLDIIEGGKS